MKTKKNKVKVKTTSRFYSDFGEAIIDALITDKARYDDCIDYYHDEAEEEDLKFRRIDSRELRQIFYDTKRHVRESADDALDQYKRKQKGGAF